MPAERVGRWDRGVDTSRFDPAPARSSGCCPGDAATSSTPAASAGEEHRPARRGLPRSRTRDDPRLHLLLAGGGPEQQRCAEPSASARLPRLARGRRARPAYASADVVLLPERDRHLRPGGARGAGERACRSRGRRRRAAELIADGRSGVLCPSEPTLIANVLLGLASSRAARDRLSLGGLVAVQERTWAHALERLADGYHRVLDAASQMQARVAA